jgi:hypothetical protein
MVQTREYVPNPVILAYGFFHRLKDEAKRRRNRLDHRGMVVSLPGPPELSDTKNSQLLVRWLLPSKEVTAERIFEPNKKRYRTWADWVSFAFQKDDPIAYVSALRENLSLCANLQLN